MIEQKENDWIVNILGNLHLSTADFKEAGLNAGNTSLLEEEVYKRSSLITENPLFKNDNGDFDDTKFHDFYKLASFMYNMLANDTYLDEMAKQQTIYGKDDIFAPKELRRTFEDTVKYTRVHNADRTTTGLVRIGETAAPKLSRDEIAQSLKVLANPVEAEKDPSKAIWHDSPNDSWFTDFFDTRVLAAWDSDGEHQDLITGETVLHKKGDLKLNENGTYYYENLDGRDVYGKLVLNKMNTLTTDGSNWNKYDFFDSDDLELKSISGSLIKNAALVGSMFIPYVGPWIAGLSVASQLVGLTGTLGKMFLGSESPTLSALEGWSKSVNRQTAKSLYALENTWCWENFINLFGDIMGQLKELRFLFEYAPAIIKGTKATGWNGISKTKQAKFAEESAAKYKALNEAKWNDLVAARTAAGKGITASEIKSYGTLRSAEQFMGSKDVENFMKSYLNIGEILSKGYMTAITVGDTYGEAKYEGGASDIEATLLTLGYAATEYKLLSTDIGKWILPELKNSGLKNKAIIKALTNVPESMRISAKNKLTGKSKKELAKYWFNKGKELATDLTLAGKGLGGQIVSGGLSEGVEEVSEELLSDVAKSCFNAVQWLQGDSNRMSAWDNVYDRYMMSFVGGAVGGGLTAAGTDFKMNNQLLTSLQAVLELVYMIRENKESDLYKTLDKMIVANPYLLNELQVQEDNDGKKSMVFKPATSESSNMDLDVKKAFKLNVEVLKSLINSEGLRISDLAFLDKLTFNDIKLAALQESPVASLYLLDFNTLCTKIIGIRDEMNTLMLKDPDDKDALEALSKKNEELLKLRLRKDLYLNGDLAMDYVGKAAFSLTPIFSKYFHHSFFKDYVKYKYDKELSELSEEDLKLYREEFENWKNTDHKNDVSVLAPLYLEMARKSGMFIQEFAKNYDNSRKNRTLLQLINSRLTLQSAINISGIEPDTNKVREDVDLNEWINTLLKVYTEESADTVLSLIHSYGNELVKNRVKLFTDSVQKLDQSSPTYKKDSEDIAKLLTDLVSLEIALNVDAYFNEFITTGAINPEIKHSLQLVLTNTKAWLGNLKNHIWGPSALSIILDIPYDGFNENTPLLELKLLDEMTKDEIADAFDTLIDNTIVLYNKLGLPPKLPELITLKDFDLVKQLLTDLSSLVDKKISALDGVTYTDAMNFILNYIQTNSDSKLDIGKLLETVNGILDLNITNLEGVILDGAIDQINEGIEVIGWLLGLVLGAQVDSDANLDNLVGYNVTMNEIAKNNHVKDYIPLPTITKDDAVIIDLDLELIKNKLLLAKAIYAINQGKKLLLQDTVAVNKNYINYNRLKKFIINVGDEWKEKNKLAEALKNAEVLKKYAESRDLKSLTDNDKEELEKERANIENAIFDFFNNADNLKRIQEGGLDTLFKKGFDLYSKSLLLINAETEKLDDRNFLWYLASRAAIRHSGFYNTFKEIVNDEVAPIPTLEESIFLNVAFILNGDMFNAFREAYIKATLDDFNNSSESEKRRILKDRFDIASDKSLTEIINDNDLINEELFPLYSNIYLTEGIPGAGKSKAVDYYTVLVIKKAAPLVLERAWVAHNTKSKAEELANSFDMKVAAIHDKNSLMSTIYSGYNTGRPKDSEGNYLYDKEDWIKDPKTNRIIYKYKSDDIAKENVPSLIIIDEVSHYDLADLMVLDDFAKKNGISIITSGDFDLSSSTAVSTNWAGILLDLILTPARSHFMGSPKLGISMRTTNTQMDKTTTSFRAGDKKAKLYYYLDDTIGINGVKRVNAELMENNIKAMISTLKPGEKIGLVYYSPESSVLDLVNKKFRDKFELFEGTSALGGEGLYYIIDATDADSNPEKLRKDIYTAITRASLGIVLTNLGVGLDTEDIQENVTMDSSYSKAGVLRYSRKRKGLLDTVYTSDDKLTYTPRKTISTVTPPAPPKIPPITSINVTPPVSTNIFLKDVASIKDEGIEYLTDGVKVAKKVNDNLEELDKDNPIVNKILGIYNNLRAAEAENTLPDETSEDTEKAIETLNNELSEHPLLQESGISETPSGQFDFTYLFHTHNTRELGIKDNDDKIEFLDPDMKRYLYRIDSIIGLMKIFEKDWKNPTNPVSYYTSIIDDFRGYLFSIPDKSDLILALNSVLNPAEDNDDFNVASLEFGLMSSPNISKRNLENGLKWGYGLDAKEFGVFDKNDDERTTGNANPDPNSLTINRKTIGATITFNNGKRVYLPLFVLGNLETYTRNPKNEISKKLASIYEKVNGDSYRFHKAIIEDPELKNIPEIYNLAKLYLFTNAGYFKIDDTTWTPAKNLKNWGIQINTSAISGEKFPYIGKDTPVMDLVKSSGFKYSKQIYTCQQLLIDDSNNIYDVANIGHSFILMSKDPRLNTDEKMQRLYELQLLDPSILKTVTLVYITPPKVPVRDYLYNLYEFIKEKDPNKRINIKKLGSHLTSYYIWKSILPELQSGSLSDKIDNKTKEKLISEIERLNQISDKQLLKNEIMANQAWEGVNTGLVEQSVLKHLNYALLSLFLDTNGEIIPDNLNNLILIIEKAGIDGIYYSTKFKNKVPSKDLIWVPLESDLDVDNTSLYSINELPFTVKAKLDSDLFSSKDFNAMIESFVNKIIPPSDKNPRETSKDTWNFIHSNKKTTTNSSNVRTIPLEENSSGLSEIKVLVQDDILTINGVSRQLEVGETFDVATKEDFRKFSKKIFGPLFQERYVDLFYDKLIQTLLENKKGNKSEDYLSYAARLLENAMLDYNLWPSEGKVFLDSLGNVILVTFTDLTKFGINEFIIRDALNLLVFNNEGIAEYLYDKDTIIRFNERTKSAEIVKQGLLDLGTNDGKYNDLMSLDPSSPIIELFNNIGWLEGFIEYKNLYDGWTQLSDLKGIDDVIDDLNNILSELDKNHPNYLDLKDLIKYLKEDNEYCTRIIKSI